MNRIGFRRYPIRSDSARERVGRETRQQDLDAGDRHHGARPDPEESDEEDGELRPADGDGDDDEEQAHQHQSEDEPARLVPVRQPSAEGVPDGHADAEHGEGKGHDRCGGPGRSRHDRRDERVDGEDARDAERGDDHDHDPDERPTKGAQLASDRSAVEFGGSGQSGEQRDPGEQSDERDDDVEPLPTERLTDEGPEW